MAEEASTSMDAIPPPQPQPEASSSRSPAPQEAGSASPPQRPSTSTTTKRPRRVADDGASGRGKRLLGMLNATLGQAKRQADANRVDAKRRAAIDARTQARLEKEKQEIEAKTALQRECQKELALCREVLEGEATHRSVRAQKRRLASFLVTSSPGLVRGGEGRGGRGGDGRAGGRSGHGVSVLSIAPSVPSSLPPASSTSEYTRKRWPIYDLPRKLTVEQEDALDDQEDRVDADIDEADAQWEDRRARLEEELIVVRKRIEEMAKEMGVGDGEEDAKKPAATAAGKKSHDDDTQMDEVEAKAAPSAAEDGGMDLDDEKKSAESSAPAEPSTAAAAAAATAASAASPPKQPPSASARTPPSTQHTQEQPSEAIHDDKDVELRPAEEEAVDKEKSATSAQEAAASS